SRRRGRPRAPRPRSQRSCRSSRHRLRSWGPIYQTATDPAPECDSAVDGVGRTPRACEITADWLAKSLARRRNAGPFATIGTLGAYGKTPVALRLRPLG